MPNRTTPTIAPGTVNVRRTWRSLLFPPAWLLVLAPGSVVRGQTRLVQDAGIRCPNPAFSASKPLS